MRASGPHRIEAQDAWPKTASLIPPIGRIGKECSRQAKITLGADQMRYDGYWGADPSNHLQRQDARADSNTATSTERGWPLLCAAAMVHPGWGHTHRP